MSDDEKKPQPRAKRTRKPRSAAAEPAKQPAADPPPQAPQPRAKRTRKPSPPAAEQGKQADAKQEPPQQGPSQQGPQPRGRRARKPGPTAAERRAAKRAEAARELPRQEAQPEEPISPVDGTSGLRGGISRVTQIDTDQSADGMTDGVLSGLPPALATASDLSLVREIGGGGLSVIDEHFARYVALGYNSTESYSRAAAEIDPEMLSGVTREEMWSRGSRMARKPAIVSRIEQIRQTAAAESHVTVAAVMNAYLDIATADPRELATFERVACRHCHDRQHRYQFTPAELRKAKIAHEEKNAKRDTPTPFDEQGGPHYDGRRPPNADCPECFGHGILQHRIADLRNIGRKGLALLAGARRTKEGLEVVAHDRAAAWEKLARHVGFFEADKPPPAAVMLDSAALDAIYEQAKTNAATGYQTVQGRMDRVMAMLAARQDDVIDAESRASDGDGDGA